MTVTITACCVAMPHRTVDAWMECAMAFFDQCIAAPDDTRDLPEYMRSRATTDYVAFLHPYQRFYRYVPLIECQGPPSPEEVVESVTKGGLPDLSLTVHKGAVYDQGFHLRSMLDSIKPDVVALVRRSWKDFAMTKPVRQWTSDSLEFQIVKREIADPQRAQQLVCQPQYGPFIEDFRTAF